MKNEVWIKKFIRIGGAYYVGVPKVLLARLKVFRDDPAAVTVNGTTITIETDRKKFFKEEKTR